MVYGNKHIKHLLRNEHCTITVQRVSDPYPELFVPNYVYRENSTFLPSGTANIIVVFHFEYRTNK